MRRECRERFPHHRGLAIPTCITARAWPTCRDACRDCYLAVSFEIGGGENVPGIPGACTTQIVTYLVRGPLTSHSYPLFSFSTPRHKCRDWQIASQVPIINQRHSGITYTNKQRVLMHGHQGWNVRHGLCHIYMIYVYIWVVYSFCLFCCLFIIVTTQFVALYKPCKPKPKFR